MSSNMTSQQHQRMLQNPQEQQTNDAATNTTTNLTKAYHTASACSDFKTAIQILNKAILEDPSNYELYRLRSTFHLNSGDAGAALDDAMACTKIKDTVGWQELGAAQMAMGGAGHYKAATAAYKKGLEYGGGNKKETSLGLKIATSLCKQAEGGDSGGGGRRRSKRRSGDTGTEY